MSAHIDPLIAAAPSRSGAVVEPARPVVHVEPVDTGPDTGPDTVLVVGVESIESVYRRLYPGLVRIAYLLVDTQQLAEEAVQDAFATAYLKWNRIATPDAYVRTCVINACRKVQRRRRVARRYPDPAAEHGDLLADHVSDVVRGLRSPMKEAVVLRYYLQLSDPEIAEALGIAVGTVKSTLHRARGILRQELS